jgi:hypothetical protein
MNANIPSPRARAIAEQLVIYEAGAGNPLEANVPAVVRVSEKLRRPISNLAGAAGFRALLARALTLAKAQAPSLSPVEVKLDGSLQGLSQLRDDRAPDAAVLLIAQLLGLLSVFVGESLMLRLVIDVWPQLPAFNADPNGESGNDPSR